MKLIFFRHGIATDKLITNNEWQDFKRDLTKEGIKELKDTIKVLKFLFKKNDVIFTSPLVRAVHTSDIIYKIAPCEGVELMTALDPLVSPNVFVTEIKKLDLKKNYCFVGHEPHLSESISILLGQSGATLEIEKGGLVILSGDSFTDLKLSLLLSPKVIGKL